MSPSNLPPPSPYSSLSCQHYSIFSLTQVDRYRRIWFWYLEKYWEIRYSGGSKKKKEKKDVRQDGLNELYGDLYGENGGVRVEEELKEDGPECFKEIN